MRLHSITLQDYRGIDSRHIDFRDQGITVVSGPNQSGKSSVIEAIHHVLTTKATSSKEAIAAVRRSGVDRPAIVELDCTIGPERFRLRKEFGRGRQSGTVLVFADPTKEALHGDPAHNYVQSLLAEYEDMDLFEALRFLQGRDLNSFELTEGQSALQAALDAAASTSGSTVSGDDILEAVAREFERYFTPTGRVLKQRKEESERLEELAQEMDTLRANVVATAERAQYMEDLSKERDELDQHLAELEVCSQDLREQAEHYRAYQQELAHLETALATTQAQLDTATVRVDADHAQESRYKAAHARLTTAQEEATAAESELKKHENTLAQWIQQRDELAAAVENYIQLATIAELLDKDAELTRQEVESQRLAATVADLTAAQAQLAHQPEVFASAEKLRTQCTLQRDTLAASTPTITVTPINPGENPVAVNGADITEVFRDNLSCTTTVDVPGHVSIVVEPTREAASLHDQLVEAEKDYQEALATLQVTEWEAALAQAKEWQEGDAQLRDAESALHTHQMLHPEASLLSQRQELTQSLAACPADLIDQVQAGTAETMDPADLTQLKEAHLELTRRCEAQETVTQQARMHVEMAHQKVADATEETATLTAVDAAAVQHHLATQTTLSTQLTQQQSELERHRQQAPSSSDPTQLLAACDSEIQQQSQRRQELDRDYHHQLGSLDNQLDQGYKTQLEEKTAQHHDLAASIERTNESAAAVKLLSETLQAARSRAAERYQTPFVEALTRLGKDVWGDHFAVAINDNLTIKSAVTRPHGIPIAYADLSAGTREQLAVLSRLACYQLVDQGQVPVILDDILGYSDPARREDMAAAITTAAELAQSDSGQAAQILIFTCDASRFADVPGLHLEWEKLPVSAADSTEWNSNPQ